MTELRQLSFKTGEELSSEQLGLPAVTDDDQYWASAFIADAVRDGLITAPQPDAAAAVSAACPDEAAGRAARVRRACEPSGPQQAFVERVFGALGGGGGVFFLSAGAGTGKTFTLNLLVNDLRASGLSVRAMASSGIASQLLPQPARTVHSSCCVPRNVENMDTPRLNVYDVKMRHHWDALWETDVFVGDEACMSHGKVYAALDNTLQEIAAAKVPRYGSDGTLARARVHPADMPFGGKVVVLAGHWAQTLPVVPRGARAHVTAACLFRQPFWAHVQVHRLEENFRLRGDGRVAAYASLLDDIGYGRELD